MRAWHVEAPGPVTGHPLRLPTDQALRDLKAGAFDGAAVLIP